MPRTAQAYEKPSKDRRVGEDPEAYRKRQQREATRMSRNRKLDQVQKVLQERDSLLEELNRLHARYNQAIGIIRQLGGKLPDENAPPAVQAPVQAQYNQPMAQQVNTPPQQPFVDNTQNNIMPQQVNTMPQQPLIDNTQNNMMAPQADIGFTQNNIMAPQTNIDYTQQVDTDVVDTNMTDFQMNTPPDFNNFGGDIENNEQLFGGSTNNFVPFPLDPQLADPAFENWLAADNTQNVEDETNTFRDDLFQRLHQFVHPQELHQMPESESEPEQQQLPTPPTTPLPTKEADVEAEKDDDEGYQSEISIPSDEYLDAFFRDDGDDDEEL